METQLAIHNDDDEEHLQVPKSTWNFQNGQSHLNMTIQRAKPTKEDALSSKISRKGNQARSTKTEANNHWIARPRRQIICQKGRTTTKHPPGSKNATVAKHTPAKTTTIAQAWWQSIHQIRNTTANH